MLTNALFFGMLAVGHTIGAFGIYLWFRRKGVLIMYYYITLVAVLAFVRFINTNFGDGSWDVSLVGWIKNTFF